MDTGLYFLNVLPLESDGAVLFPAFAYYPNSSHMKTMCNFQIMLGNHGALLGGAAQL